MFNSVLFGVSIKTKRGQCGVRWLASMTGVSASTISRIENGGIPDIETYHKLCKWLEVPMDYFFNDGVVSEPVPFDEVEEGSE